MRSEPNLCNKAVAAHAASIGRFLRKLGYTYKKNRWWQPKGFAHV
ncbi:hypothetical protein [Tateyamaria sp.]